MPSRAASSISSSNTSCIPSVRTAGCSRGGVYHQPYQLHSARILQLGSDSVQPACGLSAEPCLRSELCERTFAHICDSGGMRRSWLRGLVEVTKRYLIAATAHNLGRILRKLFGVGKPRALQGAGGLAALVYFIILAMVHWLDRIAHRRRAPLWPALRWTPARQLRWSPA